MRAIHASNSHYQTIQLADGVRYELPVRPLGPFRWFGLIPFAFGIAFSIGPPLMIREPLLELFTSDKPDRWFGLIRSESAHSSLSESASSKLPKYLMISSFRWNG